MGNSRSSHSFTKSKSRSTSLTDLPYKLGNTGYASKSLQRPSSIASTSPSSFLRPEKRSTSLGSLADTSGNRPSSSIGDIAAPKRTPRGQVNRHVSDSSSKTTASRRSETPQPTGPRQYNDDYLQSDIKKLFKAHDKTNTKAMVEDDGDTTAESLDKRLATLKKQRSKEEKANEVADSKANKKSRKTKKAPELPVTKTKKAPELPVTTKKSPQPIPVANGGQKLKSNSLTRKKSAAPIPPTPRIQEPITEDATGEIDSKLDDTNNNSNNNAREPVTPTVTFSTHVKIEATHEPKPEVSIERESKTDLSPQFPILDETNNIGLRTEISTQKVDSSVQVVDDDIKAETVVTQQIYSKESTSDDKSSSTPSIKKEHGMQHPQVAELSNGAKPKVVIERELGSTKRVPKKHKKAPQIPVAVQESGAKPASVSVVSNHSLFDATDEDDFIESITRQAVKDNIEKEKMEKKKEETAQQSLSVGPALVPSEKDEKAGVILKLFIDKNAEKEAEREVDECSPDATLASQINNSTYEDVASGTGNRSVSSPTTSNDQAAKEEDNSTKEVEIELHLLQECLNNNLAIESSDEDTVHTEYDDSKMSPRSNDSMIGEAMDEMMETPRSTCDEIVEMGENQRLTPESITDQSNCVTPRLSQNEQFISGVDVSPPISDPQPTSQGDTTKTTSNSVDLAVVVTNIHGRESDSIAEASKPSSSPTGSNDSGHHESLSLSYSPTVEQHSPLQSQSTPPLTHQEAHHETVPLVTTNSSTGANIFIPVVVSKEHKKHKFKHSGIFRITKTMRRFMSSVGKHSEKTSKVEEDLGAPEIEEPMLSTENWSLASKGRKVSARKEYKPTWDVNTFLEPTDTTQSNEPVNESDTAETTEKLSQPDVDDKEKVSERKSAEDEQIPSPPELKDDSTVTLNSIEKENRESTSHQTEENELDTPVTKTSMNTTVDTETDNNTPQDNIENMETPKVPKDAEVAFAQPSGVSKPDEQCAARNDAVGKNVNKKDAKSDASENAADGENKEVSPVKRNSSLLAFMSPKAYGSATSVYRPVSSLVTTSPSS